MTLCEAINSGLKQGKSITRDSWDGTAIVKMINDTPTLVWDDGETLSWGVDTLGFVANDYRVVEGFLDEKYISNS